MGSGVTFPGLPDSAALARALHTLTCPLALVKQRHTHYTPTGPQGGSHMLPWAFQQEALETERLREARLGRLFS